MHDLFFLYSGSGARRGELLALQWSAVDFDTGIITIARSLEQTQPVALAPGELAELPLQQPRMREQQGNQGPPETTVV